MSYKNHHLSDVKVVEAYRELRELTSPRTPLDAIDYIDELRTEFNLNGSRKARVFNLVVGVFFILVLIYGGFHGGRYYEKKERFISISYLDDEVWSAKERLQEVIDLSNNTFIRLANGDSPQEILDEPGKGFN